MSFVIDSGFLLINALSLAIVTDDSIPSFPFSHFPSFASFFCRLGYYSMHQQHQLNT
jgi:hypothetical protein